MIDYTLPQEKWSEICNFTQIIADSDLSNDALIVSPEIDNSAIETRYKYINLRIKVQFDVAPSDGTNFVAYFVKSDGSEYASGADGSITPHNSIATFSVFENTDAQIIDEKGTNEERLIVTPNKFKIIIKNMTGQDVKTGSFNLFYQVYR